MIRKHIRMPVTFIGGYSVQKSNFTLNKVIVKSIIPIAFTIFFGALLITGEPLYLGDTFQHELQFVTRDPVYALIIQFLRFISSKNHYELIIILQNILAVVANTVFLCFLRKSFSLNGWLTVLSGFVMLTPHIITPLASSSHMVITNSLLSEGIAYSLYLFFIMEILKMVWSREITGKSSIAALLWALLLSLVRGQFMVLILVWFIAAVIIAVLKKDIKKLVLFTVILAVTFAGRGLLVKTYNYCEQGLFVPTASGKAMSVANVIYAADREDGDDIEDEGLRQLFYDIYDAAYSDEMNYKFSPEGFMARAKHHEACHDSLNFDYFTVKAKDYISKTRGIYVEDYQRMMVEVDKVASELMSELIPNMLPRYIENYVCIAALGLVRSVAVENPVLDIYAVIIYIVAFALIITVWIKNHESKAAPFMALTLLTIAGTVAGTSMMIQCISRYMLYNLPLFYLAGLFLLIELRAAYGTRRNK